MLSPARSGEVLAELDGLLLTGGGDVAASWYGEEPAPEAYGVDLSRDAWELALVAGARAAGLPVLGICRGAQVVNVAAGGAWSSTCPPTATRTTATTSATAPVCTTWKSPLPACWRK